LKFPSYQNVVLTGEFGLTTNEITDEPVEEQEVLTEETEETTVSTTAVTSSSEYTNHSGGALGSDSLWDEIGREYGVVNHMHYYYGQKTPKGNIELTKEQLEEGWQHVLKANKTLNRRPEQYKNLLSRNWYQVKNADAVFAIGTFTNDMKLTASGGTGWAVQMAIDSRKTVYLFDQDSNKWYLSEEGSTFYETSTPILTFNFAGIGTREINEAGKQAIRDVYEKTFKQSTIEETPADISELSQYKLDLIPKEWQFDSKYKDKYDTLVKAAMRTNVTLKNMQDLIKHEKGC
jgi:hypothetical protein